MICVARETIANHLGVNPRAAFLSMLIIYGAAGQLMAIALSLPVLGALAGVLVVNFNPARIFLGDSGSYFLGYLLAAFSLHIPAHKADPYIGLFAMVAVLGVPVLDTFYSSASNSGAYWTNAPWGGMDPGASSIA